MALRPPLPPPSPPPSALALRPCPGRPGWHLFIFTRQAAARSLALLLAATGGGRDLADFSNRVWRHLHQRGNLPPDNPQLRAYQRNLPTLIAERARHVLELVAVAQAEGGDGAPHLPRDAWLSARRCFAFLAPGAGKSLSIALAIVLFPHAATPPPGCGVPPTAARHLIVFPFCTNINELLDEGLCLEERPCRECRAAARQAEPACCDACRNELHHAAEASSLCSRLGLRRTHVIELARHVYVLPDRFNPRENLRHRRDFEQAWIVLATQDKVARACEAGHIGPADVRALWADEGDYGNNPDERRGSFSWDIIQRTLWASWVRFTYGDLYRSYDACQLTVTTLCAHGLVVGGRRIGDEPLTEEDVDVFCRKLLNQHDEWRIPTQGVLFNARNSGGEEVWRQLCGIAARLPPSPVTGRPLRVAVAYTRLSRAEDTAPFRNTERVIAAFKALEYDIIVLSNIGCRGLNNSMIMVGLNMYPHNTSVASRNEQWQRVNRLIRPIRLDPRLVELVERLYGREVAAALGQFVLHHRLHRLHQRADLLEIDANFAANNANLRQCIAEQGAEAAVTLSSERLVDLLPPEALLPADGEGEEGEGSLDGSSVLSEESGGEESEESGEESEEEGEEAAALRREEEERRRRQEEEQQLAAVARERERRERAARAREARQQAQIRRDGQMWSRFRAWPRRSRKTVTLDTLVGSILNAMDISIHERRRVATLFQRALAEGPAVLSELAGLGGGGPLLAPGRSLLRLHERVAEVRGEPAPICAVCREPPQPGSACILCCCFGVMCVACLDRCPTCPLCRCRRCSAALVPPVDVPSPLLASLLERPLQRLHARGFTQEGLLSQSPRLFQELQFMVRRWEQALPPPPPPPPPVDAPSPLLAGLLERLRHAATVSRTYSCVFVPFVHALLQDGEMAAEAAAWAAHDPAWAALLERYREFFEASPRLAPLLQPNAVRDINLAALPGWPYIEPAPEQEDPALRGRQDEPWPLQSPGRGFTQEGLLSQSPPLFQELQFMTHLLRAVVDEIATSVLGDVMYDHAHLRRRPELREHLLRGTEREVRARLAGLINAMHGGGLPTTYRRIRFDAAAHGGGGGGRVAVVLRLLV
ncbi:hypothetical protein EMIHUDRAFT_464794 [Emiliania huxleyi CCMP1516]|uniref:RING-type domain-containing protein n=2 Tax=Emiliania huxleyi TaxID=2903 RepID=A0A0D3INX3_EMIH1|nr:hypothetical protein EMIHUDRAFT_464794 [Emiliania huxleyi CCMP1516]EOD12958.1 hypothetical protein EMIHUDRAFT_464794 [Emiliania huxleyi CCMP1516]|eukprot:XP_005765387.1 hypothetical protein EMIHUDRAFT_464794 [Emiliania huxleyi CCMP1516]